MSSNTRKVLRKSESNECVDHGVNLPSFTSDLERFAFLNDFIVTKNYVFKKVETIIGKSFDRSGQDAHKADLVIKPTKFFTDMLLIELDLQYMGGVFKTNTLLEAFKYLTFKHKLRLITFYIKTYSEETESMVVKDNFESVCDKGDKIYATLQSF